MRINSYTEEYSYTENTVIQRKLRHFGARGFTFREIRAEVNTWVRGEQSAVKGVMRMMLNKSGESGHPCLDPDVRGTTLGDQRQWKKEVLE